MKPISSEEFQRRVVELIQNFELELKGKNLRKKVLALIPIFHGLRNLGKSLIPRDVASSARDRIIHYFLKYPFTIISGDELLVVSGIQDWPRRVRELRVQSGWMIINGITAKEMTAENEFPLKGISVFSMKSDDYILIDVEQDRDAAHRWNITNEIRRKNISTRDKLLEYFRANVNTPLGGEELRYVANKKTEWARRVRELRTEYGWPIATRNTGAPDLKVGYYLLHADRQSPEHDRHIPDPIRGKVFRRDGYKCVNCEWSHKEYNPSDPRHLELHHKKFHFIGGDNNEENLVTLCTVCHDDIHRKLQPRK